MTIYTWGHSRDRTWEDLRAALEARGSGLGEVSVVDVRHSRRTRNRTFNGGELPKAFPSPVDLLHYVWCPELGNPARGRVWLPKTGLLAFIDCHTAQNVLYGVADRCARLDVSPLLLCVEKDAVRQHCHRVAVAEGLRNQFRHEGIDAVEVVHL